MPPAITAMGLIKSRGLQKQSRMSKKNKLTCSRCFYCMSGNRKLQAVLSSMSFVRLML